jgi:hypothetical protein
LLLFFGLARSCQSWPRFPFLVHAVEQVACFELPYRNGQSLTAEKQLQGWAW